MTNYEALKNDELDKLAAVVMGFKYSEEPPVSSTIQRGKLEAGKEFASYSWPINPNGNVAERFLCDSMPVKDWHPTDPDSNQCERYLFPKLLDRGDISINYSIDSIFYIEIEQFTTIGDGKLDIKTLVDLETGELDEINRAKTILCLKANDKIQEGTK